MQKTQQAFVKRALSNILASLMAPLIEIVDLMVVGNSGHVACMAGIGIAMSIINSVTWFVGNNIATDLTNTMTETTQTRRTFCHALVVACIIGLLFTVIKSAVWTLLLNLFQIEISPLVNMRGQTYYNIVSWSMPFMLMNQIILSWFLKLGHTKPLILLQGSMNLLNFILNIVFVNGLNVDLEAVALSTVIIHLFMALIGTFLLAQYLTNGTETQWDLRQIRPLSPIRLIRHKICQIRHYLLTHSTTAIQSLCIITLNLMIISASSGLGCTLLDANIILLQIQNLLDYLFNGISLTIAEFTHKGLVDQEDKDNKDMKQILAEMEYRLELEEACLTTIMYTAIGSVLLYRLTRVELIKCFTNIASVQELFFSFDGWLTMYSIIASWGLGVQGVFRGRHQNKRIMCVYVVAWLVFALLLPFSMQRLGNHGIWLTVLIFQFIRSILFMALGG